MVRRSRPGVLALVLCVAAAACGAGQDTDGVRTADDDSASGSVADVVGGDTIPEFEEVAERVAARVTEFVSDPTEEAHLEVTEALMGNAGQPGIGTITLRSADLVYARADFEIDSDGDRVESVIVTVSDNVDGLDVEFLFSFDMMVVGGETFIRFHEIKINGDDALIADLLIGEHADRWMTVTGDELASLGLNSFGLLCDNLEAVFCSAGEVHDLASVVIAAEFGNDSLGDLDWTHVRFLAANNRFWGIDDLASHDTIDAAIEELFSYTGTPMHAWIDSEGRIRRVTLDRDTIVAALNSAEDYGLEFPVKFAEMLDVQMNFGYTSYEPADDISAPADIAGSISDMMLFDTALTDS